MKYFVDNDISPRFAKMLVSLGVEIVALRDCIPSDTQDCDFLADLKKVHGADVFISNNTAQRTNPIESRLLKQSGVTSLYFMPFWSKLKFWPQAQWLLNHWEMLDGFAAGAAAGTCADIQSNRRCRTFHL